MKSNKGTLTEKEIEERTKFWYKTQFRTWHKKELNATSNAMQNLLVAIKGFSLDEIKAIRKLDRYDFEAYYKNEPKYIIRTARQKDLEYAISIAPKTFKVKQG